MYSPSYGIAVSRGRGDIPGEAFVFKNGKWNSFHSFPYSDFPLIEQYDSSTIWVVNHLVHSGDYKPILTEFKNHRSREIPLPKIMWDEIDYSMWKSLDILPDGTAWMAGQQGNIIYYDGKKWNVVESPVKKDSLPNLLAGDINDIFMLKENSGWGVGKDGLIIKYNGERWEKINSPVNVNLEKIWMCNENLGWAVGQRGTIIRFNGSAWIKEKTETAQQLFSVKGIDSNFVIVVGANSTLLFYNGKEWLKDLSVKNIDDNFYDVDVVIDSSSTPMIWITGGTGIYTNSKSIGFSFTDYTSQSSLRRNGKGGIFFNKDDDDYPELMVLNEEGPSFFYKNDNEKFSEYTFSNPLNDIFGTAAGDLNNDGYTDILQILGEKDFRLYLGSKTGFIDFTEKSGLDFSEVESFAVISAHFADFDNDGNADIYISNYERDHLIFKNDGAAQFIKILPEGLNNFKGHRTFGVTLSDFNNDGLTDVFIPFQTPLKQERYRLYLNKGNFKFEQKIDEAFLTENQTSVLTYVSVAQDFNNDGLTDILVYNQKTHPYLLLNKGDAEFKDISLYAGFVETISHPEPFNGIVNTADVNNDGYTDIFISSRLFLNNERTKFRDVSEQTGINFTGNTSFADFDADGDVDIFIESSRVSQGKGDRAILYRNNLNNKNFIKVKAEGDKSNRSAVGAKVFLICKDSTGNEVMRQLREISNGSSPMIQQNISELHFGTPLNFTYDVEVVFPSGIRKVEKNVKPGSLITVYESSFIPASLNHIKKSFIRTALLMNPSVELLKLVFFIIILSLMIIAGIKAGAGALVKKFYFYTGLIIIYLLLVHITILEQEIIANSVPVLFTCVIGWVSVFTARYIIEKRNAKYISHFRLEEVIGEGGMGKVFYAEDTSAKRKVAFKVINPLLMKDPANRKRFTTEGKTLLSLNHPNIVKVYETGEAENTGFIAMEYLPNGTLKDFIQKEYPVDLNKIKKFSLQICEGIKEIHNNGIIHRDLKTNNIMLDESENIRIMDFGLSKSSLVSTMTSLGSVLGTLGYVAPEQVTNSQVDLRADIFSFGVILYELCTNQLPFKGENEIALIHSLFNTIPQVPSSINKNIPSFIDDVVEKCLKKEPDRRFKCTDEIITIFKNN